MRLLIDIGTHEAQELKVLCGNNYYTLTQYLRWWFDWLKRQIKKLIRHKGLKVYGAGAYKQSPLEFSIIDHIRFVTDLAPRKKFASRTNVISIDPVSSITSGHIEQLRPYFGSIYYLPVAILQEGDTSTPKLVKFYLEKNSLSSSLVGSSLSAFTVCLGYPFTALLREMLEKGLFNKSDELILRMNCEGAELEVLKSVYECGLNLKLIIGSLNDVGKKLGAEKESEMNRLLKESNTVFKYFKGSDPSTWLDTFNLTMNIE